ncbi:glycoside hydrolase family 31 [Kipferlia bialata]|uniref:Glycoside hydrolase family 31 n=1 Tax=Kipferlia bialata TaxID=797122 RepID=A0A9K3GHB7_9EUKA|nr:glycoside hydrolase family 31 [Kipferlia bialata]|eukprot:g3288.t1
MADGDTFGFRVKCFVGGDLRTIFDTTPDSGDMAQQLVFENQYMQISTKTDSDSVFHGLGIRENSFQIPEGDNITFWNRDPKGVKEDTNMYGSHPYYMQLTPGDKAEGEFPFTQHGVALLNSNAMDVFMPGNGNDRLTFRTIGGELDFLFFAGETPLEVTQAYQRTVGLPYFPPRWSFGYHQSAWEYFSIEELYDVIDNFIASDIPLDTITTDIVVMQNNEDFTLQNALFPPAEMADLMVYLREHDQHYVMIIDPGLHTRDGYAPYERLLESGSYVKCWGDEDPVVNSCWPGEVAFYDFYDPKSQENWKNELLEFYSSTEGVHFDGIWADMNEPATMCNGECSFGTKRCTTPKTEEQNLLDYPPYAPGSHNGLYMAWQTLDASSRHPYLGLYHYDAHQMFARYEVIPTVAAVEQTRMLNDHVTRHIVNDTPASTSRAMVIMRSTYLGSGHIAAGTWLGDNHSTYEDLAASLPLILQAQMLGFSLTGPDSCGFMGDATGELCARWLTLGAFYPFLRDHTSIGTARQEPYQFGEEVSAMVSKAIHLRYSIMPYLYSNVYEMHAVGGSVWKPLHFVFPSVFTQYQGTIDEQVMVGDSITVCPVLEEGADVVDCVFPVEGAPWCPLDQSGECQSSLSATIDAPLGIVPAYLRAGTAMLTQESGASLMGTLNNPYHLALSPYAPSAVGQTRTSTFYLDDGESFSSLEGGNGAVLKATITTSCISTDRMVVTYTVDHYDTQLPVPALESVDYYGPVSEWSVVIAQGEGAFSGTVTTRNKPLGEFPLSLTEDWTVEIEY